jgi:hypothetical protein
MDFFFLEKKKRKKRKKLISGMIKEITLIKGEV